MVAFAGPDSSVIAVKLREPLFTGSRCRALVVLALAASLPVSGAITIHAQDVTGHIRGHVVSEAGIPLAGVTIVVQGPSLQGTRTSTTDARGQYRLLALPGGAYRVQARRIGFRQVLLERVAVLPGQTTSLNAITLHTQATELEPLIVKAERPAVDLTTTTHGAILDAGVFEALPADRDYLGVVTLLPQANESPYGDRINISGATGFDNAYYIDGVNVTEPYRGDGAIRLPFNFVDHIELKTGGYDAEYGRALGGIVSVVTPVGGNERQSSIFAFFTSSRVSSRTERSLSDLGTGRFARYDVGGSVGGSVIRDRLWYFAAYDAHVETEDVQLPGLDVRTDRSLAHRFAGKLSWRATTKTDVTLTMLGDPTNRNLVGNVFWGVFGAPRKLANPDPFLGDLRTGGWAVAMRGKHVVGQSLLLEGSLARLDTRFATEGATERGRTQALFQDGTTGTWSGGHGNAWDHHSIRTSASLTATRYLGDHSVKGGLQYEQNFLDSDWRWLSEQAGGTGPVNKFAEGLFVAPRHDFRPQVSNRVASLFGHASLRLHPRVRLNAGLRWDGQYFKGIGSGLSGSVTDQWQPRAGIIFYPGGGELKKLTVSYARFYEQIPNSTVSFWYGGLVQEVYFFDRNPLDDPSGGTPVAVHRIVTHAADDLEGQRYDELALGYERVTGREVKFVVRGIRRRLRQILTTFEATRGTQVGGNPGKGELEPMPKPVHRYDALELTLSRFGQRGPTFLVSYVGSRTYGNYTGLFDQDRTLSNPHAVPSYYNLLSLENSTGSLPNDRPHLFKGFWSHRFVSGLTTGTSFSLQSGTPLNDLGGNHTDPFNFIFLRPRGTAGRTPSVWDWNLHFAYDISRFTNRRFTSILKLDVLHAFSAKRPVKIEQRRFLAADQNGNQISPNPQYLAPLAFQPPMAARLGMDLRF